MPNLRSDAIATQSFPVIAISFEKIHAPARSHSSVFAFDYAFVHPFVHSLQSSASTRNQSIKKKVVHSFIHSWNQSIERSVVVVVVAHVPMTAAPL
jgi:hypothetical protein